MRDPVTHKRRVRDEMFENGGRVVEIMFVIGRGTGRGHDRNILYVLKLFEPRLEGALRVLPALVFARAWPDSVVPAQKRKFFLHTGG